MCAFGERPGELGELAKDDAMMPFGVRDVLVAPLVLIGGLRASENVVKLPLLAVRTSASLPRKPMRLTLFWYMIVSPFIEFSILFGSHPAKPCEWGRLPSAEALHLRRVRTNLFVYLRIGFRGKP